MRLIVAIIFIMMTQIMSFAQHMETLYDSKVKLNGKIYDFYESEKLFKKVPTSYQKYQSAMKLKKAANASGYTSLGSFILGLVFVTSYGKKDYCSGLICPTPIQHIGGFSLLLVFPISGISALIKSANSNAQLKQAIKLYNSNHNLGYSDNSPMKMSIGLTQNGVGLVVNF